MGQHGENVTGAGFGRWEHRSVGAFSVSGRHSACCHVCPQPLPVPQPQDVELGSPGWPQPQAASSAPAPCNSTPGLPAAGENLQLLYSMNGGKINSEPPLVFCFSTELENSGMHFVTGTNYLLFAFFQASRGKGCILFHYSGRGALPRWRCVGPPTASSPAQRLGHAPKSGVCMGFLLLRAFLYLT